MNVLDAVNLTKNLEILGRNVCTIGDLQDLLSQFPPEIPIVMGMNGHFGYVNKIQTALSSTWDQNAVWVVTEEDIESLQTGEFPIEEAIKDGRMTPSIYIQCDKNEIKPA